MQTINGCENGSFLERAAVTRTAMPTRRRGPALGKWVLHPFFLAVYPVLALLGQNAREVRLEALSRLICLLLVATLAIWLFFCLVLRDVRKAGVIASLAVVLFFMLDITQQTANSTLSHLSGYWVARDVNLDVRVAVIPATVLLASAAYLVKTKLKDAGRVTAILNLFSALLIAMPVAEVISIKTPSVGHAPCAGRVQLARAAVQARLPDIYYIILDGYARTDVMKSLFNFDNTPFLGRLEKEGFYLARQSIANYCQTPLSLSASLNMVYLDDLVKGLGPDQTELSGLIGQSNIVATLKPLGYKFVTFATGFDPTEHPEADVYLSPHPFSSGFDAWSSISLRFIIYGPTPETHRVRRCPGNGPSFCSITCPTWRATVPRLSRWPMFFALTPPSSTEKMGKMCKWSIYVIHSWGEIGSAAASGTGAFRAEATVVSPLSSLANRGNHQTDHGQVSRAANHYFAIRSWLGAGARHDQHSQHRPQ